MSDNSVYIKTKLQQPQRVVCKITRKGFFFLTNKISIILSSLFHLYGQMLFFF